MDKRVIAIARKLASNSGFNPDQLVVKVDMRRHGLYLDRGFTPVEISKIRPIFMDFYQEALEEVTEDA